VSHTTELPHLTLEQKWETAEENLIYFVVSGIAYAKSRGGSAKDFGAFTGAIAVPFWAEERGKGPRALVQGISFNKQQFRDFQMEILRESATSIEARMKGFGEDAMKEFRELDVTVDDYIVMFEAKWQVIANSLGLKYEQTRDGEWTVFIVTQKEAGL
jgi:hypothetical protein